MMAQSDRKIIKKVFIM